IVELDGGQHQHKEAYDSRRTVFLIAIGWEVLRLGYVYLWGNVFYMFLVFLKVFHFIMRSTYISRMGRGKC
ncbi:DUF559 domain-containing protein, partial [Enterobacter hormaechei]